MSQRKKRDERFVASSGDVYEDLGIKLTKEERLKLDVALTIAKAVQRFGYTQAEAAKVVGLDQPKVSKILRGRLDEFSLLRLMECLVSLGYDVEVKLKKTRRKRGEIKIAA
jgi:predicted XRE-type DNA-binding protein